MLIYIFVISLMLGLALLPRATAGVAFIIAALITSLCKIAFIALEIL